MNSVGQGVKEIRIRDAAGAFRVLYVAKFADAVYVLHCFQKKTEKTSKAVSVRRPHPFLRLRGRLLSDRQQFVDAAIGPRR